MNPCVLSLLCLAGWMNHSQQDVIEYLQEELRMHKDLPGKKPRLGDDQRRRLAAKASGQQKGARAICQFGYSHHFIGLTATTRAP